MPGRLSNLSIFGPLLANEPPVYIRCKKLSMQYVWYLLLPHTIQHTSRTCSHQTGSLTAGILAHLMALNGLSFKWLWRRCLGEVLRQINPFRWCTSTVFLRTHVWDSHALKPSLWATVTLKSSSKSLSPVAVIGDACSQSPEWGDDRPTANSLALSTTLDALDRLGDFWFAVTNPFQAF